jgi:predicted deacylase
MKLPINDIDVILSSLLKQLPENEFATNLPLKNPDKEYSLVNFVLGEGNLRKALISAGIHGDEPKGV